MTEEPDRREPWVSREAIVRSGDPDRLDEFLPQLPPGEPARALSRLDEERRAEVLGLLAGDEAMI